MNHYPTHTDALGEFMHMRSRTIRGVAEGMHLLADRLADDVFAPFQDLARGRAGDLERIAKVYDAIQHGRANPRHLVAA
ncbi:MAG: hypothetical protein P8N02_14920 [Actinomycetota bacterium]|nr:hypothetical protein [Actinomycetota bacterium]